MRFQTKIDNALGLDYENEDAIWIKKGKTVKSLKLKTLPKKSLN